MMVEGLSTTETTPQIEVERLVSSKNWWFSGSMLIYQRVCILVGGFKHEWIIFHHIWDVIRNPLTNSIIFQRGRSTTWSIEFIWINIDFPWQFPQKIHQPDIYQSLHMDLSGRKSLQIHQPIYQYLPDQFFFGWWIWFVIFWAVSVRWSASACWSYACRRRASRCIQHDWLLKMDFLMWKTWETSMNIHH
jgi:hypothetical protein